MPISKVPRVGCAGVPLVGPGRLQDDKKTGELKAAGGSRHMNRFRLDWHNLLALCQSNQSFQSWTVQRDPEPAVLPGATLYSPIHSSRR